jgi:RimJ/RimL family protein N-acetyltransferase
MTTIRTSRLTLRPPLARDVTGLVVGLGNLNVARWTGRVPHPYGHEDAKAFLAHASEARETALILVIVRDDDLIGGIGIENGELGYWLAEPHWGRGYGREAARAITDHAFLQTGADSLIASYQKGNEASRRILLGLGFVATGEAMGFSKARQAETPIVMLELARRRWEDVKAAR